MDGTTFGKDSQELIPNAETFSEIFTSSIVQVIAERSWHQDVQVTDYKLQLYSDEKLGVLSLHRSLIITVKEDNRIESRNFFVKLMPPKTDLMADLISQMGVFEKEALFYNEVYPLLQKEYHGEAWGPQFYFGTNEVIVLEDLRTKGFRMYNKILDKTETMSALSAIAKMHATSLLAEKKLGKSLLEICPGAFNLQMYHDENGARSMWVKAGIDVAVALAQHLDLDCSRIREAFEKMRNTNGPSPSKHNVVSHSDLWTNNLMRDDSSPPKCRMVDFQNLRYCPMAADFTMFLQLCTRRDFRGRHKLEMMKHYYDILCETMKTHELRISVPNWSEFVQGVEEYALSAAAFAVLYFPTALMDGKTFTENVSDVKNFQHFIFDDKKAAMLRHMEQNSYYNERIREALLEFVEISQRLEQIPSPS